MIGLRKPKQTAMLPPGFRIDDQFKVIPEVADGVDVKIDDKGCVHIKRTLSRRAGLISSALKKLKLERQVQLELDATGSFFWDQINGKRTLSVIAQALVNKFNRDERECKTAVIQFTKSLMLKHVIVLKVPKKSGF